MTKQIVLATGNPGKVQEMQRQLEQFGFEVIPQTQYDFEEAVEDGLSFVENAIIKARHACIHTGLPAIADDSGLEVDALLGQPGIRSARYADDSGSEDRGDQANNLKLLDAMSGTLQRSARFQCVLVYMEHAHDPTPIICQGTWEGEIATSPRGHNGFGYDPLFNVPELGRHAAELSSDQKKQLSHRGKALALLKKHFENSNH